MPQYLRFLVFFATVIWSATGLSAWQYDWEHMGDLVAYRVDGSGPAVVQVHGIGAGASSEQTKYQIDALVAAGFRIYSLDLTGWGRSIGPQQLFTGAYYAALLTAFLDEVVGEPAAIVGHSLGGTYAIAAAAARPDGVTALVLNAPVGVESFTQESTPETATDWEWFVTSRAGQGAYRLLGSWASIAAFCRTSLYVDPSFCDASTLFDYRRFTRQPDSIYGAAAFLTGNLGLDVRTELASLTQPILLIWGEDNVFTPLTEADAFKSLNPAVELVVVGEAGAMVNDEQRALFDLLLIEHLAATAPSAASP